MEVKTSVFGEVLGIGSRKVPRGLRGRQVVKENQSKLRTSRGSPRHMRICTAKASRISRETVKSGCACEWGGWGRLSENGPVQHNTDLSQGPWARAADAPSEVQYQVPPYLPHTTDSPTP